MGNTLDTDVKTNSYLFTSSVETSYITCDMMRTIIDRWNTMGRPIFISPRDFKDRILTSQMDQQIKINFLKWLTLSLDIDMFEILSVLTLYARGSIAERGQLLFEIFCIETHGSMTREELKFFLAKICTSIG